MSKMIRFNNKDIKIVNKKTAYDGFFKVNKYTIMHRLFEGGWSDELTREVFVRGNAAAVLLYDAKRDSIILVEQFRIGAIDDKNSPWLLEIVAGMLEGDDNPEDVIKREAKEEANCVIQRLIHICDYYSSPGGTSEKVYLYCGLIDSKNVGGVHGLKAEHEDILVHVVSFDDAINLLEQGKIDNAASIIAIQWLLINKQSFN